MRYFQIHSVVKKSKKIPTTLFTGTHSQAARKAMTVLCKQGACTLTIAMREVKRVMRDGEYTIVPVLDSDNVKIIRKYKIKRTKNDTDVVFKGGSEITFRYNTQIIESYGRVL